MNDIELARQLAAASTCDTRPQLRPLLRRLADRVERAEALLETIAMTEGSMEDDEPCPVCGMKEHGSWCWYPALLEWDSWQAEYLRQAR